MADIANSKLLHIDTGIRKPADACVVLVKTEWNAAIVDELEKGCIAVLEKEQVAATHAADLRREFGAKLHADSNRRHADALLGGGFRHCHETFSRSVADVWSFVGEEHNPRIAFEIPRRLPSQAEPNAQTLLHVSRASRPD